MKKIYSFLLSLLAVFAVAGTATAQSVTSVDELSNDAVYTIKSARGYLVYNSNKPDGAWCSENTNSVVTVTDDSPETYAQWVFYTLSDGTHVLYNVGCGKFLQKNSNNSTSFVETPTTNNVTLIASTGSAKDTYPVVVAFGDNQINMSKDQQTAAFTNWNDTADEGNMVAITKVADIAADVKAAIEEKTSSFQPLDPKRNLVSPANDKVYTITTARGDWTYDATVSANTLINSGIATDAANGNFAILTSDKGNTYLYSIGASMFVSANGIDTQLTAEPQTAGTKILENYNKNEEYPNVVSFNGNYAGISTGYSHGFYVGWNDLTDAGNQTLIKEVADVAFDAAEALAKIATYEEALEAAQKENLITPANDKVYTITTASRGSWAYDTAYTYTNGEGDDAVTYNGTEGIVSTNVSGISSDLADANKQFAILTSDLGNTYIYSVAAKKFINIFGDGTEDSHSGVSLTEKPETKDTHLVENYTNSTAYPYLITVGERQISISNSYPALGGIISFWNDATDEGNQFLIKEVADVAFDATEALALINEFEASLKVNIVSVTPSESEENLEAFPGTIILTLDKAATLAEGKEVSVNTRILGDGDVSAATVATTLSDDGLTATITVSGITANGSYLVNIPEGLFVTESGLTNEALTLTYIVEANNASYAMTTDPEDGSTVESLSTVSIVFDDLTEISIGSGMITVKKDGEQINRLDAQLDWDMYNKATIDLGTLTDEGVYTIEVPEGYFQDGSANPVPAFTLTYTITKATGIQAISGATNLSSASVYTLSGRRVQTGTKLNRGIYIVNGKKAIIK